MAGQDDNMIRWKYTTSGASPVTFRLRAKKALTDQQTAGLATKVGGSSAAMTDALPIRGFRPRRAYVVDQATGAIRRSVVCYDDDAPLLTAGETITLQYAGAETTFVSTGGVLNEKKPGGIAQTT